MASHTELPARPLDSGSQRLEFFSDAIMAIAITLLVIGIDIRKGRHETLAHALAHLWPSYLAYALSFCTIGLIWVAHHGMFRRIGSVDRPLLLLNLLLMLWVAFLPFSTKVLARYSWHAAANAHVAVLLYSLNMLAIGLAFQALWLYLGRHRRLFLDPVTPDAVHGSSLRALVVPAAYLVTTALSFVSVIACYAVWGAITVYIALGPATRRIAVWDNPTPPTPAD
jgi:uncharacterized membrane protein